jgi:hypothetical protein
VLSQDEVGVTIAAGAYNSVPDWEDYYFDADAGEVVLAAKNNAWTAQFAGVPEQGQKMGAPRGLVDDEDTV